MGEVITELKKVRNAQRLLNAHKARCRVAKLRLRNSDEQHEKYFEEYNKKITLLQEQLTQAIRSTEEMLSNVEDEEKRLILQLYFVDCYTIEEIAEIMGYSVRQMFRQYKAAKAAVSEVGTM